MHFCQNIFLIDNMPGRHRLGKAQQNKVAWRFRHLSSSTTTPDDCQGPPSLRRSRCGQRVQFPPPSYNQMLNWLVHADFDADDSCVDIDDSKQLVSLFGWLTLLERDFILL